MNVEVEQKTVYKPTGNSVGKPKVKQERSSVIFAACYVSESELVKAYPEYDSKLEAEQPIVLKNMLWNFGLNTDQEYERQDSIQHRNRLNQQVFCSRWVGNERSDSDWILSGYASREAIDRDKNSPLLDSLYREKYFTLDTQAYLEEKDRSSIKDTDKESEHDDYEGFKVKKKKKVK